LRNAKKCKKVQQSVIPQHLECARRCEGRAKGSKAVRFGASRIISDAFDAANAQHESGRLWFWFLPTERGKLQWARGDNQRLPDVKLKESIPQWTGACQGKSGKCFRCMRLEGWARRRGRPAWAATGNFRAERGARALKAKNAKGGLSGRRQGVGRAALRLDNALWIRLTAASGSCTSTNSSLYESL
jgi:hypothetical protein